MCNSYISNTSLSVFMINALYKNGASHACISPGSRNTPLTKALIEHKKINCTSHIDERSAAYFGLGLSKKINEPVIILTTSGTATANLFPAIIEASLEKIQLIILTADRPKKLMDSGASQTINQKNLYSNYVRKMIDLDPFKKSIFNKIKVFNKTISLLRDDKNNIPGPVHFNIRFKEPLIDKKTKIINSDIIVSNIKLNYSKIKLPQYKKPLIICGPLKNHKSIKKIMQFSKNINAPIFADVLSNLRSYENVNIYYNQYIDTLKKLPDIIFRFGCKPISKKLNLFLDKHKKITYLINEHLFNDDCPNFIQSDLNNLNLIKDDANNNKFKNYIESIESKASNKTKSVIKNNFSQANFVDIISKHFNKNDCIFIGSSTILRTFDDFLNIFNMPLQIYANYISRGIDGILSSALGMSYGNKKSNNYLFIGDISLFYDTNALHILNNHKINLNIIVINNKGGQIFSRLPYAKKNLTQFKEFWITPINTKIKDLAKLFNLKYYLIKKFNIEKDTLLEKGVKIFEVEINENVDKKFLNNFNSTLV